VTYHSRKRRAFVTSASGPHARIITAQNNICGQALPDLPARQPKRRSGMSDPLKTAVNDYFAQKERGLNIHFDDLAPATSLTGPPARRYLSAIPVAAVLAAIMVGTTMISFDPWEDPSPADIAAEPVGALHVQLLTTSRWHSDTDYLLAYTGRERRGTTPDLRQRPMTEPPLPIPGTRNTDPAPSAGNTERTHL
jgi:hypothetical protein